MSFSCSVLTLLPAVFAPAFGSDLARGRLEGFQAPIRAVAYSPDGKTLAAAGCDQVVRVWDTATLKERARLEGHKSWVLHLAFSPDGQRLASAGFDGTLRVWHLGTGRELLCLADHGGNHLAGVAFSPDGKLLASAGYDQDVCLRDAATGRVRHRLRHDHWAYAVAFSPDSKIVATGAADHMVRLWDAQSGAALHVCAGHTEGVMALVFAPDGRTLYSGGQEQALRQWDVASGRALHVWDSGAGQVRGLALSADGRTLAAADSGGSTRLWELATRRQRRCFEADQGTTWAVAFSADGTTLATAGDNRAVRLWDVTGLPRPPRPVTADELEEFWYDLGSREGDRAYTAVWRLGTAPTTSLSFLAERLRRPAPPPDVQRIARLVGELDDDEHAFREKASAALARMGRHPEEALRQALRRPGASAELRRRAAVLLARIDRLDPDADRLRALRGVEALERAKTRRLLEELAQGPADAVLTREARAALMRLGVRRAEGP